MINYNHTLDMKIYSYIILIEYDIEYENGNYYQKFEKF